MFLDRQVALQISSQYLIRHDWTIKELSDAYYDEVETTTITSYVSIPNSSDLFSGTNSDPLLKSLNIGWQITLRCTLELFQL